MKNIIPLFILLTFISFSCKSGNDNTSTTTASKEVVYPKIWQENDVPAFSDGIIASTVVKKGELKVDHVVVFETDKSFDDIYTWHKTKFAEKGWKVVKNKRKDINNDTEVIILVQTKGPVKHSILVLNSRSGKVEIKTTVSKFY